MDNKTILQFIKKDLEELRILVEELGNTEHQEQLLIDITTAKAKTLLQEFSLLTASATSNTVAEVVPVASVIANQMLNEGNSQSVDDQLGEVLEPVVSENDTEEDHESGQTFDEVDEEINELEKIAMEGEIVNPVNDDFLFDNITNHFEIIEDVVEPLPESVIEDIQLIEDETFIEHNDSANNVTDFVEESVVDDVDEVEQIEQAEDESVSSDAIPAADANESGFLAEQEQSTTTKKVFGEQFTKEPSLNDRLSSMKNIEPKIKAQPIANLKAAIGLNDRFMFTRELFANNVERYEAAIDAIDNAKNIVEAVEYLEQNFKWQKTEVSLKFIGLIKRRFEK